MKKRFLGLLAMTILLATGCGTKKETLTCTNVDESTEGVKSTQVVKVDFEDKKLTNLAMDIDVEVDDQYKDYISMFTSSMEEEFADFEDETGMTVDISEKDNKVLVKLNANYKDMDSETKKELGIVDEKADTNEVKESLEEEGFTCK